MLAPVEVQSPREASTSSRCVHYGRSWGNDSGGRPGRYIPSNLAAIADGSRPGRSGKCSTLADIQSTRYFVLRIDDFGHIVHICPFDQASDIEVRQCCTKIRIGRARRRILVCFASVPWQGTFPKENEQNGGLVDHPNRGKLHRGLCQRGYWRFGSHGSPIYQAISPIAKPSGGDRPLRPQGHSPQRLRNSRILASSLGNGRFGVERKGVCLCDAGDSMRRLIR